MIKGTHPLIFYIIVLLITTIGSQPGGKPFTLLILGDSLVEGFGVNEDQAFPALLEKLFLKENISLKVINGGSSGSTTASGVSKLKWYSKARPDALLLALGSNDGLRGVPIEATRKNLEKVIDFALDKKWQIYLAGLQIPPNYGKKYTGEFKKIYPSLAQSHKLPMLPFLLKGVAGEPDKNLPDGIHPNPEGHKIIAQNVFEFLRPFLVPSSEN